MFCGLDKNSSDEFLTSMEIRKEGLENKKIIVAKETISKKKRSKKRYHTNTPSFPLEGYSQISGKML
jgi:hypothetical protein